MPTEIIGMVIGFSVGAMAICVVVAINVTISHRKFDEQERAK